MFEQQRNIPRAVTVDGAAKPQDAQRSAIRWTVEQLDLTGGRVLILVPSKQDFASMDNLLARFAKAAGAAVETLRGQIDWRGGPVIAAWPTREALARIDEDARTKALCVIPWVLQDTQAWTQAHSPVLLGAAEQVTPVALDPVVRRGLEQLTRMVNHANNLAGGYDKRDAVAVLRLLHRGGYRLPHRDVHAWALANGWPARGAERLREMAEKIDAGRAVQMRGDSPLRPDALARWQAEASLSPSD